MNHNLIYFGEKNDWRISIFTIYIKLKKIYNYFIYYIKGNFYIKRIKNEIIKSNEFTLVYYYDWKNNYDYYKNTSICNDTIIISYEKIRC